MIYAADPASVAAVALVVLLVALAVAIVLLWKTVHGRSGEAPGTRLRVDPFTVQEPWREFVLGAQRAQRRFDDALGTTRPGPLRDRLTDIGERINQAVEECWRIARTGHDIDGALKTIDVNARRHELERLPAPGSDEHVEQTRTALQAQLASADRLAAVSADARARLRLLDARLDELVARALELSVGLRASDRATPLGPGEVVLGELDAGVDDVVDELEALRQAMEEVDRPAVPRRPPPAPPS